MPVTEHAVLNEALREFNRNPPPGKQFGIEFVERGSKGSGLEPITNEEQQQRLAAARARLEARHAPRT